MTSAGIPMKNRPHLVILHGFRGPRSDEEMRREPVILLATCPECGSRERIRVNAEGAVRWARGEVIQQALPELSPVQRERLMTGLCDPCWDALMHEIGDE